ncbi:zinc-binding dehydrogenase [Streptomyces shenzhenensis]
MPCSLGPTRHAWEDWPRRSPSSPSSSHTCHARWTSPPRRPCPSQARPPCRPSHVASPSYQRTACSSPRAPAMVGTLAIQLAAHAGAHVTTTASAQHTVELRRLGADEVLDYHRHPDHEIPGTYTKVFDLVPGADLRALLDRTQPGGRLLSVAATPTPGSIRHDYAMPAWRALTLETVLFLVTTPVRRHAKRRDVHYQRLSMRPDAEDLRTLADLIDSGRLHVPIDSRFAFDDAPTAFARMESRHAKGKVIVEVHRPETGASAQQRV